MNLLNHNNEALYNICKCKCGCEYACRKSENIPIHKCPKCGKDPEIVKTIWRADDWFNSDYIYVKTYKVTFSNGSSCYKTEEDF